MRRLRAMFQPSHLGRPCGAPVQPVRSFTATVVLILALGIGANTAIFSALNAALLEKPPFPEPERLVLANITLTPAGGDGPPSVLNWSYPKFEVLERATTRINPIAGFRANTMTLTGAGDPLRLDVEMVNPSYFTLLGIRARYGRVLLPAEGDAGTPSLVALLGHHSYDF